MRTFLLDHDPIPAWSSSTDVRDHLLAMLYARRDDVAFWTGLRELAAELRLDLRKGRSHGLPARDAEVFSDYEIEGVLEELRAALRSNDRAKGGDAARSLLRSGSPALIACMAVLGAAMAPACTPAPASQPAQVISADPARTQSADASADVSGDALVELFRDGSPQDIAKVLEAMVEGSADAAPDAGARKVGTQSQYRPPPRPVAVPRYKGITF
jgi:hypothetical protein